MFVSFYYLIIRQGLVVSRVAAVRLVEIDSDGDILEVFPHSGQ